uniref:Vacuolar protein sorting-associated protein 33A n=1 Tax=Strigamia maritima TaxID=126957 RepID=T1J2P7_STRMM
MSSHHLSTGRLNLSILRETGLRELLDCLNRCTGTKALVWDDQLIGPFGLISDYYFLKDHDVTKMYSLKPGSLPHSTVDSVVFLTRPKLSLMEVIADNVRKAELQSGPKKEYNIFFVPRKSLLCEKRLKTLGVYGTFTIIGECCIELFPFDNDLISMEMENSFKECHLENDMTSMFHVAKALMTIQALYGVIGSVYGKGKCAKHVYDLMVRMRREMANVEPQMTPQIDSLLLIDRNVDLLSPLATQLTYEGLIDEIHGIKHTIVQFPADKFSGNEEAGPQDLVSEPKKFTFNSGEKLYAEIRDCHINAVGPILSKKAKLITSQFEERHSMKTIGEMKLFVSKLPEMQSLKQSISNRKYIVKNSSTNNLIKDVVNTDRFRDAQIVEQEFLNGIDTDKVHPYIEACLAKKDSFIKILRLICMQSVTNSGLKPKILEYYKREILQTYGFRHLPTLENLEKVGLLTHQGSKIYSVVRKTLRTTVEECNEQSPRDIAYVHSGYAPLSVRLAQFLGRPGWRSIADILAMLPGPTLDETQQMHVGLRKRRGSGSSSQSSTDDQKVTIVFFLGGCTYAEIAALRFLSQLEDATTDYIIATTNVMNGTTFVKPLKEIE